MGYKVFSWNPAFGKNFPGLKNTGLLTELESTSTFGADGDYANEPSRDENSWNAIFILITMLPSHVTKGTRRNQCSALESMDNFIDFKPVGTSLEAYLKNKDKNQPVQPYLLCLGTRKEVGQFLWSWTERP